MSSHGEIQLEIPGGFSLGRIRRGDERAYVEHMADPEIARHTLAIPFPYTEADADWWVARCEDQACDPERRFAIREPSGGLIGAIGIHDDWLPGAPLAEFGYWLAKPYRGQGIMSRVIEVFARHAFTRLGVHRLYATPFSFNSASHSTLEKAGFQREGLLRHQYRKDGVYLDAALYARLSPERHSAG